MNHNCIFATDKTKCNVQGTPPSFQKIICPNHLNEVFGLATYYHRLESESDSRVVGPFLMVAPNFSFRPMTVVLPDREFVTKHFSQLPIEEDNFNYQLNPRIEAFVNGLVNGRSLDTQQDRYAYEVIRNVSMPSEKVNLGDDTCNNLTSFKNNLQTRLSNLEHFIKNSNNYNLIKGNSITTETGSIELSSMTPFYAFLIQNCMFDFHFLPKVKALAETLNFNLAYKKDVGFFTTQAITHPTLLCIAGEEQGTNHLYQTKVTTTLKSAAGKASLNRRDLPDNRILGNALRNVDACLY